MAPRVKTGLLLVLAVFAPASASGQSAAVGTATGAIDRDQAALADERDMLKAADIAATTPNEALDERHIGKRVRWAGAVYGINGRCLTINFARSGDHGEPRWTPEPTYQAFFACGSGLYDPELVHPHTNVTIIGRISGKQYIGMGGGGSDGPAISIDKLYRWSDCLSGDDSAVCKQGFLAAVPVAED